MNKKLFTSESVTEGHPDKICDAISDRILDELLKHDPQSRVACEVIAEPGRVHIMGEVTTKANVDYIESARAVIAEIGYTNPEWGFSHLSDITCTLHEQSADIAMGVDDSYESKNSDEKELGAGDQGLMFGYASNETEELMPMAAVLAHRLTAQLTAVRKNRTLDYLRPDGKSQVTVEYHDNQPVRIEAVVVSTQHDEAVTIDRVRRDVETYVIRRVLPAEMLDEFTKIYVNPTGRFVLGGPAADTGLTGRKIIVDTYGGYGHHGGGAFSGKDPTKVDRSAAYMARFVAKNIVSSGLCTKCEIQLSYAIGVAHPMSVYVDTFSTGVVSDEDLTQWVKDNIDLRPRAIIDFLELRRPIYSSTTNYGHFGKNDSRHTWEQINHNLQKSLKALVKN